MRLLMYFRFIAINTNDLYIVYFEGRLNTISNALEIQFQVLQGEERFLGLGGTLEAVSEQLEGAQMWDKCWGSLEIVRDQHAGLFIEGKDVAVYLFQL